MACPRCGEICHCRSEVRAAPVRPRFEVDVDDSSWQESPVVLVDPEPYDATEERFSASLERGGILPRSFIPDTLVQSNESGVSSAQGLLAGPAEAVSSVQTTYLSNGTCEETAAASESGGNAIAKDNGEDRSTAGREVESPTSPDAWKEEVAARLSSYRAKRRPKPPKYPSLNLAFDPPPLTPTSGSNHNSSLRSSLAVDDREQPTTEKPAQKVRLVPAEESEPVNTAPPASGRLIEFPRFFTPPEESPNQLAEPVCEHPRILDAPEVELPAPALGGIVLETEKEPEPEARPGFEVPLRSASLSRRIFAAAIDCGVIGSAGVLFGYIFLRLAKGIPPLPQLLASAALVGMILWAGYQYLLLTYSGTTLGLRVAKLQLLHFDGSGVVRSKRRWRVLASILSGVSLGLGFAWCFLDEDALCWHDRITRTHLASRD